MCKTLPGLKVKALLPAMETMMESLLSKDLLYPPLKELRDKYPDWLADNRQTLSASEFQRFNKQYQVTTLLSVMKAKQSQSGKGFGLEM